MTAQAAFHVFGMELLAQLDIQATNNFFSTFFRLPDRYWRGFLASSLSSRQLIVFAMWMMVRAPPSIQFKLMQHMLRDPAGKYMLRTYAGVLTTVTSNSYVYCVWLPEMLSNHAHVGSCCDQAWMSARDRFALLASEHRCCAVTSGRQWCSRSKFWRERGGRVWG